MFPADHFRRQWPLGFQEKLQGGEEENALDVASIQGGIRAPGQGEPAGIAAESVTVQVGLASHHM
ncbi:MAG TPA: hypothetical protein VIW67_13700 [Terriglobales bacterium]